MDGQTALTTAIIAATVALAVAGVTNAVSLFAGWRQRKHERALAAVERQYQRQADAYLEALALINRGMDWVERTLPFMGPAPDPPAPAPDDVLRRANALIALFGSDETRMRLSALRQKQRDFELHVDAHPTAERKFAPDSEEWGTWPKLMAVREECRALRAKVEESMRRDLEKA